ncbi:MAG: hypothetical protein KF886_07445 [Candidatus Hydrogenedentes bacterium]|nr:hypothetical protein [Candidatus Hydrogenedentota bacterium]
MPVSFLARCAIVAALLCPLSCPAEATGATGPDPATFRDPPVDCRPHTRWWWMGNALSKEDITFQLEQMRAQGIGGVEQITMGPVYEKGNVDYLSPEYLDLVRHAVSEAKRLGMEFSLNFGGPGWVIGNDWAPQEDRSQNMVPTAIELRGPGRFAGPLPVEVEARSGGFGVSGKEITAADRLIAVVAGRIADGSLDPDSLVDLTAQAEGHSLAWEIPEGDWRLMAFWLTYTGDGNAIDHFNTGAMERHCAVVGGKYKEALGADFGTTVESVFCDSFEVALLPGGIYWSGGLLDEFEALHGYDLRPWLPAIWWEVGDLAPRIRYDVNAFLHHAGIEHFFKPFLAWCEANGVKGRIQPYGFPTDILEGAGMTHLPEMEITAGEKDTVPWFDTRIGPREYTASGAHLYGRNVITVEAYTYIHWEPYRATLEELKIASDTFFRAGANKFYNHGYVATPERDIAPSRGFFSGARINHENTWWKYYHHLADYVARTSYLMRQGHPVADIAIYSPLASQWTKDVLNARKWTRGFEWGALGGLLHANGYDFDLINDDVLQGRAVFDGQAIRVGDLAYRMLLLPNIEAMPLDSLERIRVYVEGGGVAIALERAPEFATGLRDHAANDARVRSIAAELFDTPRGRDATAPRRVGDGQTYHIREVIDRSDLLSLRASVFDPFVNTLRRHVTPDFGIDFVREDLRENNGLVYEHRRAGETDIYFVANIQDRPVDMRVAFRVSGKEPAEWDPFRGAVTPLLEFERQHETTVLPLRLGAWGSTAIRFTPDTGKPHLARSDLARVTAVGEQRVEGLADHNGVVSATWPDGRTAQTLVEGIPAPLALGGAWRLVLESPTFSRYEATLEHLECWTKRAETKHFSGTGVYELDFTLPDRYLDERLILELDLGAVGGVAEVEWNDKPAGVVWIRDQRLDVTPHVRSGLNQLRVRVTNTQINRIAGLDRLPPVPEPLQARYGAGKNDDGDGASTLLGFAPLPRSGMLGPVRLIPGQRIHFNTK